ncbi:MAG: DUF4124 domain-containing protein [Pseudomonadota bacterium]
MSKKIMLSNAMVSFFILGLSLAAHSADIYKWVDENGKIHFGDAVPPGAADKIKKMELKIIEPDETQRQEALARVAKEKALSDAATSKAKEIEKSAADAAAPASAAGTASKPKPANGGDCFAPYRNANGSIKPEGLAACADAK